MQVERRGLVYRLFHWGTQADMQVMTRARRRTCRR